MIKLNFFEILIPVYGLFAVLFFSALDLSMQINLAYPWPVGLAFFVDPDLSLLVKALYRSWRS